MALLRVIALKADLANADGCLKIFAKEIDLKTTEATTTNGKSPVDLPKGARTRAALEIL